MSCKEKTMEFYKKIIAREEAKQVSEEDNEAKRAANCCPHLDQSTEDGEVFCMDCGLVIDTLVIQRNIGTKAEIRERWNRMKKPCSHVLTRGVRIGEECDKGSKVGTTRCGSHTKKIPDQPEEEENLIRCF